MKFNEAQQKERIANGLGSLALALDILVLIALVTTSGWIAGGVWAALSTWSAVNHYRQVNALADPPTEKELFTCSGEVRVKDAMAAGAAAAERNDDDLMAADLTAGR